MLDIRVFRVTIVRARVASLDLAQSLDVDLIEEQIIVRSAEKFHAASLTVPRRNAIRQNQKRRPFLTAAVLPFDPQNYCVIAACNSCIALRMSWRAFWSASNFFCWSGVRIGRICDIVLSITACVFCIASLWMAMICGRA